MSVYTYCTSEGDSDHTASKIVGLLRNLDVALVVVDQVVAYFLVVDKEWSSEYQAEI